MRLYRVWADLTDYGTFAQAVVYAHSSAHAIELVAQTVRHGPADPPLGPWPAHWPGSLAPNAILGAQEVVPELGVVLAASAPG